MTHDDVKRLLESQTRFQGWGLEFSGSARATHSETLFFRSRTRGDGSELAVKRIDSSVGPLKAAETVSREFAALAAVRSRVGPKLLSSLPEPLLVLPEAGLLVLQKLPGVALHRLLGRKTNRVRAPWRRSEICAITRRVGALLGEFHTATSQGEIEHDAAAFEAGLKQKAELCANRGLDVASAEELLRIAAPASRALHGIALPAAARHGDFTVRNVLVDDNHVAMIDFENFADRSAIYEDLGTFVTYMALLESQPLYSPSALRAASAAFLEGYSRPLSRDILKIYSLKAAVSALAERRPARGVRRMVQFESLYTRQLLRLGSEPRAARCR